MWETKEGEQDRDICELAQTVYYVNEWCEFMYPVLTLSWTDSTSWHEMQGSLTTAKIGKNHGLVHSGLIEWSSEAHCHFVSE